MFGKSPFSGTPTSSAFGSTFFKIAVLGKYVFFFKGFSFNLYVGITHFMFC